MALIPMNKCKFIVDSYPSEYYNDYKEGTTMMDTITRIEKLHFLYAIRIFADAYIENPSIVKLELLEYYIQNQDVYQFEVDNDFNWI